MSRFRKLLSSIPLAMAIIVALAGCSYGVAPSAPAPIPTTGVAYPVPTSSSSISGPAAAPTAVSPPAVSPTPSATTLAPPAPGTVSPAVETAQALVSELADEAWDRLVRLTGEFSPRESGTEQEKVAADYLADQYRELGYMVEIQPFDYEVLSRSGPVLTLKSTDEADVDGFPMQLTGTGQVTGIVVDVGRTLEADIPTETLDGNIALIERGVISFEDKVTRVAAAGASAAVIYNNVSGMFGGRLSNQANIPAISISRESGERIKGLMAAGEVEATVSVVMDKRDSRNVVAEKPGGEEDGKVVVFGGHYDTVPDTQGANDNGSGTATLLTVAQEVSDRSYPFTLRFISFGSEEVGLFGSRAYVDSLSDEDRGRIVAMLNFDVPGSGDLIELIGNFELVGDLLEYGQGNELPVRRGAPLQGASSDHASFRDVGVPVVFFLGDDISRINSPADTLEFVKPELMGTTAVLGLALLDILSEHQGSN